MPNILVVDDDQCFRALLENRFADEGYSVETASNGNQALEKLELHDFNVVVTDVMMPEMGGIELVRKLRAARATRNLPVIFLTGSSYSEIDAAYLKPALKQNCVLPKTGNLAELLEKVRCILKKTVK